MKSLNLAALSRVLKSWLMIIVYIFSIVPMVMIAVYYLHFSVFWLTLVVSFLFAIWIDCMEFDY